MTYHCYSISTSICAQAIVLSSRALRWLTDLGERDFLVTFDLKSYYYHIEIDYLYHVHARAQAIKGKVHVFPVSGS